MIGAKDMSTSETQKRAIAKYQNESTDLIRIRVPKGKKEQYQALADKAGAKSLTAYITSVLEENLKKNHI